MTTSGPTLSIIPSAAVIDPHLTAPDIRVLALLGTHADRVGRCWPSIPTLAKPLGVSPRWVQRCLRKLERLKYVSTHPRPGRASIYEIKGVNQEFRGEPGVQGRGEPGVQGGVNQEFTQNDTKNDTKERNRCFEEFWSSFPSRNPHANPKILY